MIRLLLSVLGGVSVFVWRLLSILYYFSCQGKLEQLARKNIEVPDPPPHSLELFIMSLKSKVISPQRIVDVGPFLPRITSTGSDQGPPRRPSLSQVLMSFFYSCDQSLCLRPLFTCFSFSRSWSTTCFTSRNVEAKLGALCQRTSSSEIDVLKPSFTRSLATKRRCKHVLHTLLSPRLWKDRERTHVWGKRGRNQRLKK